MKKYKVYLFDFDGTLFDTSLALQMVFKKSYEAVGVTIREDQVAWLSRVPLPESYKELNAPTDLASKKIFYDKIEETVNSEESVNLSEYFPETEEFFKYVKTHNISIGIVTSNNSRHVRDILNHFDLPLEMFKVIIGNVEAPRPKPDPLPVQVALKELGIKDHLEDIVYVGDSPNDCLSAINAGISYIYLDRENNGLYKDKSITNLMELFND